MNAYARPFVSLEHIATAAITALLLLATACGSDSATAPAPRPARLELIVPDSTIYEGDVVTLAAVQRDSAGGSIPGGAFVWSVSDTTRGDITAGGTLTVYRAGTLNVTVRNGLQSATRTLTVYRSAVRTVTVNPGMPLLKLVVGAQTPLGVRVQGEGGRDLLGRAVQLSSDDNTIASIDAAGRVIAKRAGMTFVRATTEGVSGSLRVEVVGEAPPSPDAEVFTLTHLGGVRLPKLLHADTVSWDGQREYHEVWMEDGTLTLSQGIVPRYQITVRAVEYAVRDIGGRRDMQVRARMGEYDRGLVSTRADDLLFTSEYISPLSHTARTDARGVRVRFRVPGDDELLDLYYRREP